MKATNRWAIGMAAVGVAAVALSGCSNHQQDASPTSSAAPQSSTAPAAATASAVGTAPSSGACAGAQLHVTLGRLVTNANGAIGQNTQPVVLTNPSASSCTLTGFPDVDLIGTGENVVGATGPSPNYRWTLEHTSAPSPAVTIQPSGTGHFDITYLADNGGDAVLKVTAVEVKLPGESTHPDLAWSAPVMLQDMATHPGTYVGPFTAGS